MNEHENLVTVMIMEQKQNPSAPRLRMYQSPRQKRYNVGVRGLIFFLLGLLVLFIGFVGYLEYNRLVKPYIEFYICCLPAIVLAGLLFFIGFASKITTIRQVQIQRPRPLPPDEDIIDLTKPDVSNNRQTDLGKPSGSLGKTSDISRRRPGTTSRGYFGDGLRKYEPEQVTEEELKAQKRNLVQFLKDLDDQHRDGLLMDGVYLNLKTKYKQELNYINMRLSQMSGKKLRKTKEKEN